MIPFDEEELAYIARLDADADAALLQREFPWLRQGCLRTLQVLVPHLGYAVSMRAPGVAPEPWLAPACCWQAVSPSVSISPGSQALLTCPP